MKDEQRYKKEALAIHMRFFGRLEKFCDEQLLELDGSDRPAFDEHGQPMGVTAKELYMDLKTNIIGHAAEVRRRLE